MPDNQPSTEGQIERTPTGQIADKGQTTAPMATTPQTSTTTETLATTPASTSDTTEKSLVNQAQEKSLANQQPPAGAPESYEPFTVPEGYTLDEETIKEAGAIFKEYGLNQTQAQKLVDFHVKQSNEAFNAPYQAWNDMQAQWIKQVKSDPFLGPRLNQVTSAISKAIDLASAGNPKLAEGFRQVMDSTGVGNHPDFIKLFYEMASRLTEGGHVAGKGPSPAGQRREGAMPSAAQAMYPNLPSG
ncbi:MAG TPA: hypothetical protein VH187_05530 [Scandinavium sp.]|jgi:hypothetical protein|uniref:hypothetical protein n=1 Tax=Scandinavium sp. TaxID=2830653 RepID=UPI002E334B89|nr:hypothetical protein [Scandinavium sp.]HEX4500622.1 hypothetical protein [Scandinavium sp.]